MEIIQQKITAMCIRLFVYNNKQPETSYALYSFKFQAMLSNGGLLRGNNMACRNSMQFQNWKVLKYKTLVVLSLSIQH